MTRFPCQHIYQVPKVDRSGFLSVECPFFADWVISTRTVGWINACTACKEELAHVTDKCVKIEELFI